MRSSQRDSARSVREFQLSHHLGSTKARFVGRGVASEAWQLRNPAMVLRFMPLENPRPVTYPMEHVLLSMLGESGVAVFPEPILHSLWSAEMPRGWKAWALETWVEGRPWRRTDGLGVWGNVGKALDAVHSIRVESGLGPLKVDGAGRLVGLASAHHQALSLRWATAPMWSGGDRGPIEVIGRAAPALGSALQSHGVELLDVLESDEHVVLHSDLHAAHVLVKDGRLAGLIDFGGAFRGIAAWDFAAIGIFNGWAASDAAIATYQSPERPSLRRKARILGLAFAVYRFNVESAARNPTAARRMVANVKATLGELDAR